MLSVHAPDLARAHLDRPAPRCRAWCQGFSEPDAGSDLASLRTKAVRDGDDWIVDGHKIWTSQATVSQRCVVLLRTGTPESRHRGLSMMLVDHDTPGVEVREIRTMSGRDELGEVLFDGVRVGGDRLHRQRRRRLGVGDVPAAVGAGDVPVAAAGRVARHARRAARTQRRRDRSARAGRRVPLGPPDAALGRAHHPPAGGGGDAGSRGLGRQGARSPGPSSWCSISSTRVLDGAIELDDDRHAQEWRHDYLFSRSAPIYGGSYEIQRQILADRVLGMPRG